MSEAASPAPLSYLAPALRLFAAVWAVVLLLEFLLNVWPLQFQSVAWRYAAEGLLGSSVPALALTALLLNTVALLERKHRALRRVVRLHAAFACLYLVAAVDFGFNALELRQTSVPGRAGEFVFLAGAAKVVLKYLAFGALQLLAAAGSWRWLRANPVPEILRLGAKRPWWLFWWPEASPPPRRHR